MYMYLEEYLKPRDVFYDATSIFLLMAGHLLGGTPFSFCYFCSFSCVFSIFCCTFAPNNNKK